MSLSIKGSPEVREGKYLVKNEVLYFTDTARLFIFQSVFKLLFTAIQHATKPIMESIHLLIWGSVGIGNGFGLHQYGRSGLE
jgi:hypothetical protein